VKTTIATTFFALMIAAGASPVSRAAVADCQSIVSGDCRIGFLRGCEETLDGFIDHLEADSESERRVALSEWIELQGQDAVDSDWEFDPSVSLEERFVSDWEFDRPSDLERLVDVTNDSIARIGAVHRRMTARRERSVEYLQGARACVEDSGFEGLVFEIRRAIDMRDEQQEDARHLVSTAERYASAVREQVRSSSNTRAYLVNLNRSLFDLASHTLYRILEDPRGVRRGTISMQLETVPFGDRVQRKPSRSGSKSLPRDPRSPTSPPTSPPRACTSMGEATGRRDDSHGSAAEKRASAREASATTRLGPWPIDSLSNSTTGHRLKKPIFMPISIFSFGRS
jgi:hypothetical protein